MGTWTVAFYSDDNVSYSAANGEGTDDGTFTFYADGLAVIALDGDTSTYHFDISEENGTLAFRISTRVRLWIFISATAFCTEKKTTVW